MESVLRNYVFTSEENLAHAAANAPAPQIDLHSDYARSALRNTWLQWKRAFTHPMLRTMYPPLLAQQDASYDRFPFRTLTITSGGGGGGVDQQTLLTNYNTPQLLRAFLFETYMRYNKVQVHWERPVYTHWLSLEFGSGHALGYMDYVWRNQFEDVSFLAYASWWVWTRAFLLLGGQLPDNVNRLSESMLPEGERRNRWIWTFEKGAVRVLLHFDYIYATNLDPNGDDSPLEEVFSNHVYMFQNVDTSQLQVTDNGRSIRVPLGFWDSTSVNQRQFIHHLLTLGFTYVLQAEILSPQELKPYELPETFAELSGGMPAEMWHHLASMDFRTLLSIMPASRVYTDISDKDVIWRIWFRRDFANEYAWAPRLPGFLKTWRLYYLWVNYFYHYEIGHEHNEIAHTQSRSLMFRTLILHIVYPVLRVRFAALGTELTSILQHVFQAAGIGVQSVFQQFRAQRFYLGQISQEQMLEPLTDDDWCDAYEQWRQQPAHAVVTDSLFEVLADMLYHAHRDPLLDAIHYPMDKLFLPRHFNDLGGEATLTANQVRNYRHLETMYNAPKCLWTLYGNALFNNYAVEFRRFIFFRFAVRDETANAAMSELLEVANTNPGQDNEHPNINQFVGNPLLTGVIMPHILEQQTPLGTIRWLAFVYNYMKTPAHSAQPPYKLLVERIS